VELLTRPLDGLDPYAGNNLSLTNVAIKRRLHRLVNETIAGNLAANNHDPILRV